MFVYVFGQTAADNYVYIAYTLVISKFSALILEAEW
jgi:hypothetical protein